MDDMVSYYSHASWTVHVNDDDLYYTKAFELYFGSC